MNHQSHFCRNGSEFDFIKQSITILSVDKNPHEISDFFRSIADLRIFNVISVKNAQEAVPILSSRRVHLCLTELNIDDIDNNEYYLPQVFSKTTRFIALTGQKSCAQGGRAILSGIADVFDKPIDISTTGLIILRNSVYSILAPGSGIHRITPLERSLTVLFEKSPATVDQWAQELNVAACTLREMWDKQGIPPKAALFIWLLYKNAFCIFFSRLFPEKQDGSEKVLNNKDYARLRNMYYCRRSYWIKIIDTMIPQLTIGEVVHPGTIRKKLKTRVEPAFSYTSN